MSTERNDQTEQEERREIKQRLNRKVRFIFIPIHTCKKDECIFMTKAPSILLPT